MNDDPREPVAHPEALARLRELTGEPDPEGVAWAERVLGVAGAERRAS
jgi:hypothetical protein